jgi:hypothetical protein
MSEPRPLVTFALFTYNQEAYVAEAVAGALSQEYSPLEIIISDDASTDRTFDIIGKLTDRYRGPHDLRIIRNDANLGIGAHVTKVARLARGELIVAAAGDDVSMPARTRAMAWLWETHLRRPDLMCCDFEKIDRQGRSLGYDTSLRHGSATAVEVARHGHCALGATAAWSKRLWRESPGLPPDCTIEDQVLTLRAAMSGGVERHAEPLVRYRIGSSTLVRSRSRDDPIDLKGRLEWAMRMRRALSVQSEDAHRHGRPDLVRHLQQRMRTQALLEMLYRQSGWPPLEMWRGAVGVRAAREAVGAVAATRFPWARALWRRAWSLVP